MNGKSMDRESLENQFWNNYLAVLVERGIKDSHHILQPLIHTHTLKVPNLARNPRRPQSLKKPYEHPQI
jgi:hypothetical protein